MKPEPEPDQDRINYIACLIESYLKRRPTSMDSLNGIVSWWIKQAKLEEPCGDVEQALEVLISKGVVQEVEEGFYRYSGLFENNQIVQ